MQDEIAVVHREGVFDITARLLEVLQDGVCKRTRLASGANLDTRSFKRYISLVLSNNLIAIDGQIGCFRITDKGRDYLEQYRKLKELIVSIILLVLPTSFTDFINNALT